jgi:hypothetical protein
MALVAQNVRVAVTGGIYRATLGTTLPTNATSSLSGSFTELGYVSEEGVTQSIGRDVNDIAAWQNGDVVRVVQTSHTVTFSCSLIETKGSTLSTFYGNHNAGATEIRGDIFDHYTWVLQAVDGDVNIRLAIPDGQVTETGDVTWTNGELVAYPITITAFPDDTGVKAYKYISAGSSS